MLIYCIAGVIHPERVPPILRKSELPSEAELGEFAQAKQPVREENTRGGDSL